MATDSGNFIETRIEADRAAGRWGGRVATRFPPEPNGYLHLGHSKSIHVNFGLARRFGGTCNLRYDDTNPSTEDTEYVDAILRDVRWLGFEPDQILYASDYFEQIHDWAVQLVRAGKAYVDDQTLEQIRAGRGTVTEPGTPSPFRDRSVEENLDLFARMRAGEFPDGARVLRARIDMGHANMQLRDPVLYRIRHAHHHRTGNAWCIYPLYDWAHGQSDAIEGITHSICTLEFEVHRELYDWFTANLGLVEPPNQIEFARLNLSYTVMSKRFLLRLVQEGRVDGWDDPRMPTLAGIRRKGVTPDALALFCERIGVARANSVVDVEMLDWALREDLNGKARRRMAVLDPVEVVIDNAPEGTTWLDAADYPADVGLPGSRKVPFTGRICIDRADFSTSPPKGWQRLVPGGEVRLRHAWVLKCTGVETNEAGEVLRLRGTLDLDTLGKAPVGRKVKGVIHWVDAAHGQLATVNLYERLFTAAEPGARTGDYLDDLNPNALVVKHAVIEPSVLEDAPGVRYQLERVGYVYRPPEDAPRGLVFNLIVGLKDTFGAEVVEVPAVVEAVVDPKAGAEAQAQVKLAAREAFFADAPEARTAFEALVAGGASQDDAWIVASDVDLRTWHAQAAAHAGAGAVARWIANGLVAELAGRPLAVARCDAGAFGRLVALVAGGTLSTKLGREVLAVLVAEGGEPKAVAEARGLVQVSDAGAIDRLVEEVLGRHAAEVARVRGGEVKLVGFLVGQVMKASGGKVNPALAKAAVEARLAAG